MIISPRGSPRPRPRSGANGRCDGAAPADLGAGTRRLRRERGGLELRASASAVAGSGSAAARIARTRTCRARRTRGSPRRRPRAAAASCAPSVNGTICTSNRPSSSAATVRLMPSTAIDPLRIESGASVGRKLDREPVRTRLRAARRRPCPTPSTWPSTKWPPSRPSARSGRSRLTRRPGASAPSVVTRSVSGDDVERARSARRAAITVRQTPFTAMLSPAPARRRARVDRSAARRPSARRRRRRRLLQ